MGRGILQIADLGLAAFHEKEADTQNRKGIGTSTPSGTSRYEPPEMDEKRNKDDPRSRQYDIWSIGCVLLELLLWLMYGYGSLGIFTNETPHFWYTSTKRVYIVHPYVESCMKVMMEDLKGKMNVKVYIDLLDLVRDRLLVVAVSDSYQSSPTHRETANNLCERMERIAKESTDHFAVIKLEYPADRISKQTFYKIDGSLALPQRGDVHRLPPIPSADPASGAPSIGGNGIPIRLHAPTGEGNLSSESTDALGKTVQSIHQEVS